MSRYAYGAWHGGPDPLAAPVDVRAAVDELGRDVMEGRSVAEALRDLLRRGVPGRRGAGLSDLQAAVARRRRELRRSGDLAGTLERVRELLHRAVSAEQDALAGDPSDAARLSAAELDSLPADTARAVRELEDYTWRSPDARQSYEQIRDMLRREVVDQQLAGVRQALQGRPGGKGQAGDQDGTGGQALRDLLADLNTLLAKHARGEDADDDFRRFMDQHGNAFGGNPQSVDDLVDELARQATAAERFLRSLSPEQRAELSQLVADALGDVGLAAEMSALRENLRALRPGLDWSSRERFTGSEPLGYGDATQALAELADLDALAGSLAQAGPGSSLDDVDVETVERQLGPGAAAGVAELRELERALRRQGWLAGGPDALRLSPKALRRLGESALSQVLDQLSSARGGHEQRSAGTAGEPTGSWRPWTFGNEQPLDAVRTVSNAVVRTAATSPGGRVRLTVDDFAVVDTENRAGAAVALCVDLSWSMYAEGRWAAMKQTALALDHLVTTRYPQDALQLIGFARTAEPMTRHDLATAEPAGVQGTNLQQALALARRHLARHPQAEPVLLVVTDGEPTAHTEAGGDAVFTWPTTPQTLRATLSEVDALTRSRVRLTTFVLGDDDGLRRFVDAVARRNGGRVVAADPTRLGEYVVADYLRARHPRARAAG